MSDEDAFLAGIAADRADRTRLLVFADWLADRADPREEFVRVHTRLLDMDGTEPEFAEQDEIWRQWTYTPARLDCMPQAASGRLSAQWLDAICRVCITEHVEEYAANGRDPEPLRCEMSEYGHTDHIHNGEVSLTLYHGKPSDYDTPFEFVSDTLLVDLWDDPFLARGAEALDACEPATRGVFWNRWRECVAKLREPPPLPVVAADNPFLGAQFVRGDWNNWGVVATYQRDYFALFWSTTD